MDKSRQLIKEYLATEGIEMATDAVVDSVSLLQEEIDPTMCTVSCFEGDVSSPRLVHMLNTEGDNNVIITGYLICDVQGNVLTIGRLVDGVVASKRDRRDK